MGWGEQGKTNNKGYKTVMETGGGGITKRSINKTVMIGRGCVLCVPNVHVCIL